MKTIFQMIGCIVFTIICIAIPVLCGVSYALGWNSAYSFILSLATAGEGVLFWFILYTDNCIDK